MCTEVLNISFDEKKITSFSTTSELFDFLGCVVDELGKDVGVDNSCLCGVDVALSTSLSGKKLACIVDRMGVLSTPGDYIVMPIDFFYNLVKEKEIYEHQVFLHEKFQTLINFDELVVLELEKEILKF